jgi:hypothetical protein
VLRQRSGVESLRNVPRLNELTAVLLDPEVSPGDIKRAADALYDLLFAVAPVPERNVDTPLPCGRALSPWLAALCVKDAMRTAVYLRGVEQVLRERRPRRILYAGCGPFAPLALPLMARCPETRFTFLDIHPPAIDSVRMLTRHFGFANCELVVGDATQYEAGQADVVIAETMQSALAKEPQVAIFHHLSGSGATMIPQNVSVDVVLVDGAAETARAMGRELPPDARIPLGRVVDLRSNVFELSVQVPDLPAGRYTAAYFTRIEVFGEHTLDEYQSGLTYPKMLWDLSPGRGERLVFRYLMGPDPGIVWERS